MSKKINSRLTKEMLQEWGIQNVKWNDETNTWDVMRFWHKNKAKEKKLIVLKINDSVRKHKYADHKTYPVVSFSVNCKPYCISLSRFVYAWFKGEVPEGMVVDHIDNNPYNNRLENLQILTPEENLKKRFEDNPNNCKNQIEYIQRKQVEIQLADTYMKAQDKLVELTNLLTEIAKTKPMFATKELEKAEKYFNERIEIIKQYEESSERDKVE